MIYLYIKDGEVVHYPDTDYPREKYGLKKPVMEITEEQFNAARGVFRIVKGKIELGPTTEELTREKAEEMREQRDALLVSTDKYLLTDFPVKASLLAAIKDYRQKLRDLPTAKDWPYIKEWPENPIK